MKKIYSKSAKVSISFDARVDAADIAKDLATELTFHRWPAFIRMTRPLADGYESLLKVPQHSETRRRHRVTFGTYVGGNARPDIISLYQRRRSVEVIIESTGVRACKVTARASIWCANFLFYRLLRSSDDWGLVDALRSLLPAIDDVRSWHPPSTPYRSLTLFVETDAETMRNWLLRRTADTWKFEVYSEDGSGFKLTPGEQQSTDDADIRISVGGLLICRRDLRGLQAGFKTPDLIVIQVEALSATRSKIDMSVSEERFDQCFSEVLAALRRDYPKATTSTANGENPDKLAQLVTTAAPPPLTTFVPLAHTVETTSTLTKEHKRGKKAFAEYERAAELLRQGIPEEEVLRRYRQDMQIESLSPKMRLNFWRRMRARKIQRRSSAR